MTIAQNGIDKLIAGPDPINLWVRIQSNALIEECGLDPDILATVDETAPYSYAIVRYGKLCHEFYHPDMPGRDEIASNISATKTLAATVFGRAVTMSTDLPRPLSDMDLFIVTRNAGRTALPTTPWDMVRSALIKHDPMYQGDEESFCTVYREGDYAPNLIPAPLR